MPAVLFEDQLYYVRLKLALKGQFTPKSKHRTSPPCRSVHHGGSSVLDVELQNKAQIINLWTVSVVVLFGRDGRPRPLGQEVRTTSHHFIVMGNLGPSLPIPLVPE